MIPDEVRLITHWIPMQKLSPTAEHAVTELAGRHGFSREAVASMLESVARGNGTMAQFSHAEFGGSGQWMGGGMTMVSDMFNDTLKARVSALCADLAKLVAKDPGLARDEAVSLSIPPAAGTPRQWWPDDLGAPNSSGAQNAVRYAYFSGPRRLAIEVDGQVTVYDTLDHSIGSFSQEQSRAGSLSFHSQHGLVDVATLPVVSTEERKP